MIKSLATTALAAAALISLPSAIEACCMVPKAYDVAISQKTQEAIIMHHGDREELILKINYQIKKNKADAKMPSHFAWIITVPNEPDHYAVADKKVFKDMYVFARDHAKDQTDSRPADSDDELSTESNQSKGLEFGKRVKVGPYDIQPVRALGKFALEGLNQWLTKNGFPTEDPEHMAWFVENKFTFLAVKVQAAKGEKSVDAGGDLPPMHLSFKSEKPYYPLRFSSRQGVFDLNLYLLTTKKFDYEKSTESLKKLNFQKTEFYKNFETGFQTGDECKYATLPTSLQNIAEKTRVKDQNRWFLNVLRTKNVNKAYPISNWKDDVFFDTSM